MAVCSAGNSAAQKVYWWADRKGQNWGARWAAELAVLLAHQMAVCWAERRVARWAVQMEQRTAAESACSLAARWASQRAALLGGYLVAPMDYYLVAQ